VAAAAQLVDRLRAEARLEPHPLRMLVVRREEPREVIARELRSLDRLLDRHAERLAVENELQRPLLLLVDLTGARPLASRGTGAKGSPILCWGGRETPRAPPPRCRLHLWGARVIRTHYQRVDGLRLHRAG